MPIRFGHSRNDRGSVSGFVVVITIAVLACAGLVVDGARVVSAKLDAADHAENAARAGAQEVVARDGVITLDVVRARESAQAYLSGTGVGATLVVTPARITVTVSRTVEMTLLSLVGVSVKTVSASRSSAPVTQGNQP